MTTPALRQYIVHCAGLAVIRWATSAGMACMDAMELYGATAATAKPAGGQP